MMIVKIEKGQWKDKSNKKKPTRFIGDYILPDTIRDSFTVTMVDDTIGVCQKGGKTAKIRIEKKEDGNLNITGYYNDGDIHKSVDDGGCIYPKITGCLHQQHQDGTYRGNLDLELEGETDHYLLD
jgi:hypothetical protein